VTLTQAPRSPVPPDVEKELERVVLRWHQLPLDRAQSYAGRVRRLVQSLADRVAEVAGAPVSVVPDCGPATLMDQLTVMVYDACATAVTTARTSTLESTLTSTLRQDLGSLRRELG
jgi:hypothetical protein